MYCTRKMRMFFIISICLVFLSCGNEPEPEQQTNNDSVQQKAIEVSPSDESRQSLIKSDFQEVKEAMQKGEQVMKPDLIEITHEHLFYRDKRVVFLLGENHASVRTQMQVASIIEGLYDVGAVEALLVEGSNGPIKTKFGYEKSYWRTQLEWGKIAGYEYVALTRPGTVVFGVEDMEVKRRYKVALLNSIQTLNWNSAVNLIEKAILLLRKQVDNIQINDVQQELIKFEEATNIYNRFVAKIHSRRELERKLSEKENRLMMKKLQLTIDRF
jgi:hypothetical protein